MHLNLINFCKILKENGVIIMELKLEKRIQWDIFYSLVCDAVFCYLYLSSVNKIKQS